MPLIVKNDAQIKVGSTPGLVAGASSFTFDGTSGKPDYRGYDITISEYGGRSPMIEGLDYSWDSITGQFQLLTSLDVLKLNQWYKVHFQDATVQPDAPAVSSLIDATYFIRNINIPNIDASKLTNSPTLNRLNSFIEKYEPECLKKILGQALYNAVLTETSQRITDLIYGCDYIDYYSVARRWDGLVQPSLKISLIANYIYYFYEEANTTQSSGLNTNIPKGEASIPVSPGDKMTNAWWFFSKEVSNMIFFLWSQNQPAGSAVYPEFTEQQRCYVQRISRSNQSPF